MRAMRMRLFNDDALLADTLPLDDRVLSEKAIQLLPNTTDPISRQVKACKGPLI